MAANLQTRSERFCAADSDVTFESSDHVLFLVHRKNLETHSEGFAPPAGTLAAPDQEIVELSESAAVLDLLFQFMYPQWPPDLKSISFKIFADLAEAAEKYQVYGAMFICNSLMKPLYQDHPFEVMMYAIRHGYPDLVDLAQRRALQLSPAQAFDCMSPAVYIAWTRFYAQWINAGQLAAGLQLKRLEIAPYTPGNPCSNGTHASLTVILLAHLAVGPVSLLDIDALFEPLIKAANHTCCAPESWKAKVQALIKDLPNFSSFL
ncbi:hypothetical protein FIBSPDRAFT_799729 [Athelia psychrophila]|uniref:BTB domain-containing protein n=1 Tax=Athelia psychrophila TaxID=1759441 RepID=A0A166AS66_9AGAM|nr:hypothetical protein FIBSPDRAFT_799729 [Fibularhizoctonia sp. CBS 109695]